MEDIGRHFFFLCGRILRNNGFDYWVRLEHFCVCLSVCLSLKAVDMCVHLPLWFVVECAFCAWCIVMSGAGHFSLATGIVAEVSELGVVLPRAEDEECRTAIDFSPIRALLWCNVNPC